MHNSTHDPSLSGLWGNNILTHFVPHHILCLSSHICNLESFYKSLLIVQLLLLKKNWWQLGLSQQLLSYKATMLTIMPPHKLINFMHFWTQFKCETPGCVHACERACVWVGLWVDVCMRVCGCLGLYEWMCMRVRVWGGSGCVCWFFQNSILILCVEEVLKIQRSSVSC